MPSPKVSIIVPVYNVEKYLPECIDSILAQTFTDFELLLIDDGSPDNSGKICDEYAARDSRIRVFHKVNGGVSSARNMGLDNAKGEWITFVDSDDRIVNNCLETCFDTLNKSNVDLLQFKHSQTIEYAENNEIYNSPVENKKYIKYYHPVCIGGAIFKALIIRDRDIRFRDNLKLGEDQLFIYDFIMNASTMMYLDKELYFYRPNESSATNTMSFSSIIDSIKVLRDYRNQYQELALKLDEIILDMFFKRAMFKNMTFNELTELYRSLKIKRKTKTRSFSTTLFKKISCISIPLAMLFGNIYFMKK